VEVFQKTANVHPRVWSHRYLNAHQKNWQAPMVYLLKLGKEIGI